MDVNSVHTLFPKTERLCSRKDIKALFAGGNRSFTAFPLRLVFKASDNEATSQVLISVSKRHFKYAVDRNRTKRQIREGWRLNRDILPQHPTLHIAFIWLSDELKPTELVHRKIRNLLHRTAEQMKTNTEKIQGTNTTESE